MIYRLLGETTGEKVMFNSTSPASNLGDFFFVFYFARRFVKSGLNSENNLFRSFTTSSGISFYTSPRFSSSNVKPSITNRNLLIAPKVQ